MTVFNVGSINADHFYYLDHLPQAGETLLAGSYARGLGGKGANQSIAAALGGAQVFHVGAIGSDGVWARDRMVERGVDVTYVIESGEPTGHAIINVDALGENAIVVYAGANALIGSDQLKQGLIKAKADDVLMLQNETNASLEAAKLARELGMRVVYSAAPFDPEAVRAILPEVDLLLMNEGEAAEMERALGAELSSISDCQIVVTKGAEGIDLLQDGARSHVEAVAVEPVDTTGAGDCFAGFLVAALDQGESLEVAARFAAGAAALKVTRKGTSDAFPTREEVETFLASRA